tara:strand:- start:7956 stop:8222 length:267 start_codon:yes stop_codon:yes gene_type:complete
MTKAQEYDNTKEHTDSTTFSFFVELMKKEFDQYYNQSVKDQWTVAARELAFKHMMDELAGTLDMYVQFKKKTTTSAIKNVKEWAKNLQ